jgi:tetratricopeptide (TPR) repeat protein
MGKSVFKILLLNKVVNLVLLIFVLSIATPAFGQSKVLAYMDSIKVLLQKPHVNQNEIERLNNHITEIWKIDPGSDEIINHAHQVLELARNSTDETLIADALINLVRLYLLKYESTKSLEYALEALRIYERTGDHEKMGYTFLQLGIVYYTQNNYLKSLEYYNNAVNEFEKVDNESYIATLYYLSGINYSKLHNHASAQVFLTGLYD